MFTNVGRYKEHELDRGKSVSWQPKKSRSIAAKTKSRLEQECLRKWQECRDYSFDDDSSGDDLVDNEDDEMNELVEWQKSSTVAVVLDDTKLTNDNDISGNILNGIMSDRPNRIGNCKLAMENSLKCLTENAEMLDICRESSKEESPNESDDDLSTDSSNESSAGEGASEDVHDYVEANRDAFLFQQNERVLEDTSIQAASLEVR
ncbi:hypothetical protein QAD02_002164 [Eretmocerus hayati]|uniref:Uncharacterized protein n=2 Tax=Eretmocerus hayati TaxID=131215 RepID=A0ACC2NIE6_9HYME|nr:hypothetical protein QAD02_002163 [Eretmocerus hayati]KAJ8670905.1 hypothetical protein QAD02_002164 [Eretmocerus hayati]